MANREFQYQASKDAIIRCSRVVKHVLGRLTVANRDLVADRSLSDLDGPSANLTGYVEELSGYEDDGDFDVDYLNDLIDQLLVSAYMLPALPIRTTPEVLLRATEHFDSEVRSKVATVEEHLDVLRTTVASYSDEIEALSEQSRDLYANSKSNLDEQFESLNSDVENLMNRNREATEQLERDVTSIQEIFRESQRQREEDFAKTQTRRNDVFRKNLDPTIAEIEDFRDQAKSMLEEVAGASTAEHYATLRDKQDAAANRWRVIGVVALVCWVVASVWIFYDSKVNGNELDIFAIVFRSSVAFPLVVLATYALRQSGHHRQREEDISRVANELMLLWPFMNRLSEEDRKSLLLEITPLYFKGGLSSHDAGDHVGLTNQLSDLINRKKRNSSEG